jgi:hypothetical protein
VALAAGTAPKPPVNQAVTVTGTLTYTWHGDPSRGCAHEAVCGSHGALIVHFDGYGQLFSTGRTGSADLQSASATVRVRRDDPGMQPGECVDTPSLAGFGIHIARTRPGHYLATLASPGASSGRCAGPLAADLARLRLPASRLRTRALGFDLRGRAVIAAGPFSGELVSTVVLHPDTSEPGGSSTSQTSFAPPPPPHPPHSVFIEYAKVRYRISGATGALRTSFTGQPEPLCEPLDSCGVVGALSVSLVGYRDTLELEASRVVPHRVGPQTALADLRAGRLVVGLGSGLFSNPRAAVSETTTRGGAAGCRDTTAPRVVLQISGFLFGVSRGAIPIFFGSPDQIDDLLRTHCAGPSLADVSGSNGPMGPGIGGGPLALGSLASNALGSKQITISLGQPGSFAGAGYSGTRSGSLRFSLTLLRVASGTRHVRVR